MTTLVNFTSTEGTLVHSFSFKWHDPRQAKAHADALSLIPGISDVSVKWDLLETVCEKLAIVSQAMV